MALQRLLPALLFGWLSLSLPTRTHAEDFPLQEYGTHVDRYLKSIENISVEYTDTYFALDGSRTFRDDHSFISIANYYRVRTTYREILKNGKETSHTVWILLRPDGYYEITEKADGQFLLKGRQSGVTSPLLIRDANSPIGVLMRPTCRMSYPLVELLAGRCEGHTVQATNFRRLPPSDGAPYRFTTIDSINGGKAETEYELNDRWLLNRYSITSLKSKAPLVVAMTYTTLGERWLPEMTTFARIGQSTAVTEFRNYKVYSGSPQDFSLTQFGLPEAVDFQPPKPSRRWLYLLVSAAVLLCAAFVFRRLYRRPSASTAKST